MRNFWSARSNSAGKDDLGDRGEFIPLKNLAEHLAASRSIKQEIGTAQKFVGRK